MIPEKQEFLSVASIIGFTGASMAVFLLSSTCRLLFERNSKWIVFAISTSLAFGIAAYQNALGTPLHWLVALVNACLLFLNGLGLNEATAHAAKRVKVGTTQHQGAQFIKPRWLQSWFASE